MFKIDSITIYQECLHRKNLKPGIYTLGNTEDEDFFGKNISLHVLVGKNGSGKSSLLDLVLRMINNVGAIMCKNQDRNAAEQLSFVTGIYADLVYSKASENNETHKGVLCIRDTAMWLTYDEKTFWMSDIDLHTPNSTISPYFEDVAKAQEDSKTDWSDVHETHELQDIANAFFYTIATNYSMQGYLAGDYAGDKCLSYGEAFLADSDGNLLVTDDDQQLVVNSWQEKNNWIGSLFHKNDGYLCPIVLNPYRNDGLVDMNKEFSLTITRLSSLLLIFKDSTNYLLDDYELDKLEYTLNANFYKKFTPVIKSKKDNKNLLENGGDIKLFSDYAQKNGTFAHIIMDVLKCPCHNELQDIEWYSRFYLVYKLLNIAGTYPRYNRYKDLGDINNVFRNIEDDTHVALLKELTNEVYNNHSHVELKFHQALDFINRLENLKLEDFGNFDTDWMKGKFDYEMYHTRILKGLEQHTLDDYIENMPLNIFNQDILLKKRIVTDGQESWYDGISFNQLSSGEKQFILQMTTLVYHLQNLKSVSDSAVRYHDVNIVLDEIEVCFHPDYQRQFVNKLLNLLDKGLHFTDTFGIHIWMTTHSPFVLSDIPNEYIISLKDGAIDSDSERTLGKTFCANVYELLHCKFFMDDYVGDFAMKKLDSLIKMVNEGEIEDLRTQYHDLCNRIEMIGDTFIREKLKEQLDEKCMTQKELRIKLEKAKQQVKNLEQLIKYKSVSKND